MSLSIMDCLKAVTGNENLDAPVTAVDDNDGMTVIEQHALLEGEIVEQQLTAEAVESFDTVEEMATEVVKMEQETEELEEVVEGMEYLLSLPNLNRGAMDILYKRATKLNDKLGGAEVGSVAGNESLTDDADYRQAMVTGCESFMDTVKKSGEVVASFIKHLFYGMIDAVVNFFNLAFDKSEKAKKFKAEVDGKEMKKEVSLGGWNRFFDGKLLANDSLLNGLAVSIPKFGDVLKLFTTATDYNEELINKVMSELEKVANSVELSVKTNSNGLIVVNRAAKGSQIDRTTGSTWIRWDIPYNFKGDAKDAIKVVDKFRFAFEAFDVDMNIKAKLSGKVPPILKDKSEVKSALDSIVAGSEEVKKIRDDLKSMKASVDQLIGKLKKGDLMKSEDKDKVAFAKICISLIKRLMSKFSQLVNTYCRMESQISSAKLAGIKAHF